MQNTESVFKFANCTFQEELQFAEAEVERSDDTVHQRGAAGGDGHLSPRSSLRNSTRSSRYTRICELDIPQKVM